MDPRELLRIAFVTRRFADLQGLRTIAYGAALLVGVSIQAGFPRDASSPMLGLVMFASLFGGAARITLDRYYRRTFGALAATVTTYALLPDLVVSGLMLDAMLVMGDIRIGIGGIVLFGLCLRILIRDWPHRPHYAIGVAAGVGAVISFTLAPPRTTSNFMLDPAVAQYFAVGCGLVGVALVLMGLLDHRLLVHAMWRQRSADAADRLPPQRLATPRIALSAAVAATLLAHFGFMEWPSHAAIVMGMVSVSMLLLMIAGCWWPDLFYGLRVFKEAERAREAALLARIEGRSPGHIDNPSMSEIPRPDFWGHLVLPAAMACGALADIPIRESGFPSFLALALGASHLRIAIRDWPDRKHYLLGAAAGFVGAAQHMMVGSLSHLDWAVSFLMLVSTAMLIEGLLDRRLESHPRRQFSDDRHANTV